MRTTNRKFVEDLVRIKFQFEEPMSIANKNYGKTRMRCNTILKIANKHKLPGVLWENPFTYSRGYNTVIDIDRNFLKTQRQRNNFKRALLQSNAGLKDVQLQLVTIETNRKTMIKEG